MEITKEEFYNLNQLDRIEFRQRYNNADSTTYVSLNLIFAILAGIAANISDLYLIKVIMSLGGFMFIGFSISSILISLRNKRRILADYFKITKKQNGKRKD